MTIQSGFFEEPNQFQEPSQFQQPSQFIDPSVAAKRSLRSSVGQVSPALYAAGARTNLTREERNLIETWSSIKGTHEKLMAMNNKKAAEEFKKLSQEDQAVLQAYYKIDYSNKEVAKNNIIENPTARKILGLDNGIGNIIKSPFRALFGGVEQYVRAYNVPFTAGLETAINRENYWTRSNFEISFDGQFSYDNVIEEQLVNKHGAELSFAAQHLLAGKTPGEILDAWGPNDGAILAAVNQVFNEPDKIASIMDEFDRARLSPGRVVARWVNKTFDIDAQQYPGFFKGGSGSIDLAFQIFADPLTYLTAGRSTFLKADRLTAALKTSRNTTEYFADPSVIKYFEGYGEKIGEYSKASRDRNSPRAAKLKEEIMSRYPRHGTDEEIKLWADPKFNIVDFDTFKNTFLNDNAQNFSMLVQGKVVGTAFSSSSAVYAKPTREITLMGKEKIKEIFRGKAAFDKLDEVGTQKLLTDLANRNLDDVEKAIEAAASTGLRKVLKKFEYQFSLHPGSKGVFTNERYIETIETVRQQANLVFKDKPLAHLFTEHFISATPKERFALKRSLDELAIRSTGMLGLPGGKAYMDDILNFHYGDGLFGVTDELVYPPQAGVQGLDTSIRGPLEPSQLKEAIGALDWRGISEFVANAQLKAPKELNVRTVSNLIGGTYNSKILSDFVDNWSILTLAPQLGVRSAIDEGFFYTLVAKLGVMREFGFLPGKYSGAQRYGKAFAAATGSKASTGPIKNVLQVAFGKLTGKEVGPVRTISAKERDNILLKNDDIFNQGGYASLYERDRAIRREFMELALVKYGDNLDDVSKGYLLDLGEHNPTYLANTTSLKIIDSTMNRQNIRSETHVISRSNLDKSLMEAGLSSSGLFKVQKARNMSEAQLEQTMFNNFIRRFNQEGFNIGGTKNVNTNPGRLFIANNGLRTKADWDNATNQFLEAVGFRLDNGVWTISNKKVGDVQRFINASTHMEKFDGLSDVEKVRGFITDTFTNLYSAFHGDALQFNNKLLEVFRPFITGSVKDHRSIVNKMAINNEFVHPSGKVRIPSYSNLIENHKAKEIVSDLSEVKMGYAANARIGRDKTYEAMARQHDDLYRAPAVQAHYVLSRRASAKEETAYAAKIAGDLIKQGVDPSVAKLQGKEVSREFFTSRALTDATNRVLKYVDNPDVRTVFSYNIRTVARFYRAVEDFHRRLYRLVKDEKLSTIYRTRLMSQGLESIGEVHEDPDGEQYVILPMDDFIYSAVDGTLRMLTNDQVSITQPLFNDITFNLTAGNPSFQTDAGMPYLSGPAGAMSVVAIRSLLGNFKATANFAEDLDQWTLGAMGDSVQVRDAIVPRAVNNVWKMLSPDERSTQETSAYMQALAYNQANDLGINPEDYYDKETKVTDQARLDEDKRKYLDNTKISSHNIIVTRILLGMILPFSVQSKDTKDLPTYLKANGIVSMKSSFYEVLDQVKLKYPDVENHYELAIATWMGKNPGKTAYLVSTNQEAVKPLIRYSDEMQNWAITNLDAIEKYGNGALLFAPNTGEFSPGVYKWAEASGIVSKIPANKSVTGYIEDYYKDLMLKEYANAYYDIADREEEDLRNVSFSSSDLRRASIQAYSNERKQYKIGVPGLEDYIEKGSDNDGANDFIQSAYNYVNSPNADVKPEVKKSINEAYKIYNEFIDYANYITDMDPSEGANMKRVKKAEAEEKIQKLIKSDTSKTVEQYYTYGLRKIMNKKSRDARPTINTNVVKKAVK